MRLKPDMTVATLLDMNPMAAQVLFRYGVRSFFSPAIANETIEQLSQDYNFNLATAVEELNRLFPKSSDLLIH